MKNLVKTFKANALDIVCMTVFVAIGVSVALLQLVAV